MPDISINRVPSFSGIYTINMCKVELVDLPGPRCIDRQSVAVNRSGYCTILDVSFSDRHVGALKIVSENRYEHYVVQWVATFQGTAEDIG